MQASDHDHVARQESHTPAQVVPRVIHSKYNLELTHRVKPSGAPLVELQ